MTRTAGLPASHTLHAAAASAQNPHPLQTQVYTMGKTIKSLRRNPDAPLWRDVLEYQGQAETSVLLREAGGPCRVEYSVVSYNSENTDGPPDHRTQIGGQ